MRNLNRFYTLAATLFLSVAAFAQGRLVSTPVVEAIESGKFYMKVSMSVNCVISIFGINISNLFNKYFI